MPFLRMQQIIWDQLLAFEADLTKVKLFLFLCQKPCGVYYLLVMLCFIPCLSVAHHVHFFHLLQLTKV